MFADVTDRSAARLELDESWESFLRTGAVEGVRPEIARSWRRARDHHVDPALRGAPLIDASELARRREEDETLAIAAPILEQFSARLAEQGRVLAYVDASGHVLSVGGDPRLGDRVAELNFRPGGCFAEEQVGTNAVGTSLIERRPIEVFASEHYVQACQAWTCVGAPILAPGTGEPLGVIDISGPWDSRDPQALLAAAALAAIVEERLHGIQGVRDELIRHALRTARGSGDALLAVDARGRLLAANDAARRRLRMDGELPAALRSRLAAALRGAPLVDEFPLEDLALGAERRLVCAPVQHLGRAVGAVLRLAPPVRASATLPPEPSGPGARYRLEQIRGDSAAIQAALDLARIAARNDLPVVLTGESGTGKELFAHGIHAASGVADGPFVIVNCGALPAPLAEGELLGHEPGRLDEAGRDGRMGRIERASGGTLFLDEVSELAPVAQTALLRALQEGEVTRLGGTAARPVQVRVVAATSRRLEEEVVAGRLRSDLFFRLHVLSIEIPPLRDRSEDVPLLARAALAEAEAKLHRSGLSFSDEALRALSTHHWPGNVRELRNVVQRAAAVAAGIAIGADDLQLGAPRVAPPALAAPAPEIAPASEADGPLAAGGPDDERKELLAVLEKSRWNIARTATSLGVSRMTLYRRLRKLGITR